MQTPMTGAVTSIKNVLLATDSPPRRRQLFRLLLVCVLNLEQAFLSCTSLSTPTLFPRMPGVRWLRWIAFMKALKTPLPTSPGWLGEQA